MEARFAFLHQRDNSVNMLRLKMSRRKSQSLKENRNKVHNLRRRLGDLPEQDSMLQDVSTLEKSVAVHELKAPKTGKAGKTEVNSGVEDRKKMLARYKEAKELQKEKERREREKKGVFKCGLYQPQLPARTKSEVPSKVKVTQEPVQSTRVTRSMRQPAPPLQQKTAAQNSAPKKEAVERKVLNTRQARNTAALTASVTKPKATTAEPVTKPTRPTRAAAAKSTIETGSVLNPKTRSTSRQQKASSAAQAKEPKEDRKEMVQRSEQKEEVVNGPVELPPPQPVPAPMEEAVVQAEAQPESVPPAPAPPSFAPDGFVFQAPAGLPVLQPTSLPLSSASAIPEPSLEPESEDILPEAPPPASPSPPPPSAPSSALTPPSASPPPAPMSSPPPAPMSSPPPAPMSSPPPAPTSSPPQTHTSSPPPPTSSPPKPASSASTPPPPPPPPPPSVASAEREGDSGPVAPPSGQQEEQHGVPYFRAILVSETDRLSGLSKQWEPYFDDDSIPEEMRDRMRTAVGQARLLMKERFGQFRGLVDDCEFKRGEKVTTCTDLQGFWDMVYFQVEDVDRKFSALKEAEGRGWTEEMKPAPRQRKVAKKPPAGGAVSRPGAGAGAAGNAAAKSRLAAIKAAMKAKQQQAEAEKAALAAAAATAAAAEAAAAASTQDCTLASAPETPSKPPQPTDTITFNGGFFQVESPAKAAGAARRSCRLSVAHIASPCPTASPLVTPSRHRRSHAPFHPSPLARRTPASTPARLLPTTPAACTPQSTIPTTTSQSFSPERPCPASPMQLILQPAADQSPRSPEAAPALDLGETLHAPPNLLVVSSPSVEQNLPIADSHVSPAEAVRILDADVEMTATPETPCTGEIPGLDFERYLQTTVATGPSPNDSAASQAFSPMVVDAEMESPEAQREDALLQTPTALPRMPPLFTPQMEQPVESNLLLFTPELKNRVRQSMCEHDLMSFTPPQ